MPMYMCRWPNGDFSFVSAPNKQEAVAKLDEIDNAEGCPFSVVEDLMVHIRLEEDGTFELEGFGEVTEEVIWKEYPLLDKTLDKVFEEVKGEPLTREHMEVIGEAVSKERGRVQPQKVEQPVTLLGQQIKNAADRPTSIIDRELKESALEQLKEFKPKGKPN
ncbi:MAG: hypothetical protein V3R94_11525 [Acidobacteriota bacterium]